MPRQRRPLIHRGDIWDADIPGVGVHPVIVVTLDTAIPVLSSVVCVLVTSTFYEHVAEIEVGNEEGLDHDSAANCDIVFTLPNTVLSRRRGHLGPERLHQLEWRSGLPWASPDPSDKRTVPGSRSSLDDAERLRGLRGGRRLLDLDSQTVAAETTTSVSGSAMTAEARAGNDGSLASHQRTMWVSSRTLILSRPGRRLRRRRECLRSWGGCERDPPSSQAGARTEGEAGRCERQRAQLARSLPRPSLLIPLPQPIGTGSSWRHACSVANLRHTVRHQRLRIRRRRHRPPPGRGGRGPRCRPGASGRRSRSPPPRCSRPPRRR